MNNLFNIIRIVLIEPSHSGNVGSTARNNLLNMNNVKVITKGIDNEA